MHVTPLRSFERTRCYAEVQSCVHVVRAMGNMNPNSSAIIGHPNTQQELGKQHIFCASVAIRICIFHACRIMYTQNSIST